MTAERNPTTLASPETPGTKAPSLAFLPLGFAVLIFSALFLLDFPKPGLDDLFFVGASLNLAQGGDYSNALLERQEFPSHFYFVHPPTYSYALAGWLRLFGVSSFSMLGFQLLMYVLISGATIAILRRYRAPRILAWLVPLGVAAAFLPEGLRPESFSVALTMCGFAFVQLRGRCSLAVFSGFLLLMLGASGAERITLFSAALSVAAVLDLREQGFPISRSVPLVGLAGVLVCALLMYLINFKLGEFWNTFRFTAAGRISRGGAMAFLLGLFPVTSIVQSPIMLLWLASLPLWPRLCGQVARTNVLLVGALVTAAALGASGHGAIWYIILMLFFAGSSGTKPLVKIQTVLLPVAVASVLLMANSRNFIYAAGIISGRIQSNKGDRLAEAQALRSTPEHPVLLDSQTARYVFDYRLPTNFLDWSFSSRFPGSLATDDALRPGDIYLVGPDSVEWLNLKTHLNLTLPKWKPLGSNKTFHEFPRRAHIIRPEECGEVRKPPLNR